MKKILFLYLFLLPFTAFCRYELNGYWKEIYRRNNYDKYVPYRDTMKIEFRNGNEYMSYNPDGSVHWSTYYQGLTGIELSGRFYNIVSFDGNYMLLGDEWGYYKFKRYTPNADEIKRIKTYKKVYDYPTEKPKYNEPIYTPSTQNNNEERREYRSEHSSSSYWHIHSRADEINRDHPYNPNTNHSTPGTRPTEINRPNNYTPYIEPMNKSRKPGQLVGFWREVSRRNNNVFINFTDTIFIEFKNANEYIWQKSGGFIYRGTYIANRKSIDLGMRYFEVISNDGYYMEVTDGVATYEFENYIPGINTPDEKKPEIYDPVYDIRQMVGHWSVYKRTSAYRPAQIDYTRQLKMIDIYDKARDGAWGDFFSQRDADNAPSWYVEYYDNQVLYCNGKDRRQFNVIKCQDNELIIEEAGTTYFFKQFR